MLAEDYVYPRAHALPFAYIFFACPSWHAIVHPLSVLHPRWVVLLACAALMTGRVMSMSSLTRSSRGTWDAGSRYGYIRNECARAL